MADDDVLNDIVRLLEDNRYGKAREMLAVALGNMRSPRAVDVLMDLLGDETLAGHAAIALGKLRASTGRDPLRALARRHPKEWVRTEAQKAIMAINNGL
ncbi:PBS lyase HEAT-like repeat protein [compost metagenome]